MKMPLDYISELKEGENLEVEFKSKFNSAYIARAISAFANTNGGRLYIGVKDDGSFIGMTSIECEKYWTTLEGIIKRIKANAIPYKFGEEDNKFIIVVEVEKSKSQIIYSSDGIAYKRVGDKTERLNKNECCVSAIMIRSSCKEIYCKNLEHTDTIYFLNERCKESNGKVIINEDYQNVYPDGIFVSAIVGMNGSGKSALYEIMYRIINNFSCLLERDLRRRASEVLYYVDGLCADLYYVINGELYCISCNKTNVQLKRGEDVLLDMSVNCPKDQYVPLNQKELAKFSHNLFYSIVTNYSIQSLVCSDFKKDETF